MNHDDIENECRCEPSDYVPPAGYNGDGSVAALAAAATQQAEPTGLAWLTDVEIDEVVRQVAELPDRTSPEDWPEAMLVTAQELRFILADVHAPVFATAPAEPTEEMLVAGLRECEPLGELIDWHEGFGRDDMRRVWAAMCAAKT